MSDSTQHTTGLLAHVETLPDRALGYNGGTFIKAQSNGGTLASLSNYSPAERRANARRLVACWNAFDGVATGDFEGKSAAEYVADQAYLVGLNGSTLDLSGSAVEVMASSFAGQFIGSGATNYLEARMTHKELGSFTVTMQRQNGETPAQQVAALRAEVERLREALQTYVGKFGDCEPAYDAARAALKGGA